MLEQWNNGLRLGENNGMVGLENQNEYNCIDFHVIVVCFFAEAENGCLTGIIIKC